MKESVRVMISEEKVNAMISEMGERISRDYEGKSLRLICVLKGSVFFACELAKRITVPVSLDFMSVSSYGNDTRSSGVVKIIKDLDDSIEHKDVLLVEDIVDSGRTLTYLMENLKNRNPASLKLCTMLDKPTRRVPDLRSRMNSWWVTVWIMPRNIGICPLSGYWNSANRKVRKEF